MSTIEGSSSEGQQARENTIRFSRVSNASDGSRFQSIKVDPAVASDEINFWVRQVSEHALFIYLGLEEPNLKQEALDTHMALEKFRKEFNKNPTDIVFMNTVFPLLKKEREFTIKVLRGLDQGKWFG